MRFVEKLRQMKRSSLLLILAALIVVGGGLAWAAVRMLRPAPAPSETLAPDVRPRRTETVPSTVLEPGSPPATLELVPVDRTPGDLVLAGDLNGVAESFNVEYALEHVEVLTAPEYGGRVPGAAGGYAAGEYIAEQFAAYGLLPAGTDGYFQPFSVPYAEVTAMPVFEIMLSDGTLAPASVFREDYAWVWGGYSGGGVADGKVFWLNLGDQSDYQGLDVTGEIVLVRSENAEEAARQALEHGAEGLLLLTDWQQRINMRYTYRKAPYLSKSLPTLWVSPAVASTLLEGSGYTLDDLSFLYRSLELATRAHIIIEMDEPGEAIARNVLGVLPGADPELRDQALILGAHYDHLGVDPDGQVHAGANDDASGVGVMLEIARSWQSAGYTPERTVLFAAWDAEEQGLFGSAEYVERPRLALGSTVGMIQLDMVGLAVTGTLSLDAGTGTGRDGVRWVDTEAFTWSRSATDVLDQLKASAAVYGVSTEDLGWGSSSDHASFLRVGVPAVMLTWDRASVPYYHTPSDTLDTLQPERLREMGILTSHAAMALAGDTPNLQRVLIDHVDAIRAGDANALTATLDDGDTALTSAAQAWLAERPTAYAQGYRLSVEEVRVYSDTASVRVTARALDEQQRAVTLGAWPVQCVRRGAGWRISWPVAQALTTSHLTAEVVAPAEGDRTWVEALDAAYATSAELLGLSQPEPLTVTLFPNQLTRDWLYTSAWTDPGRALLRSEPITATAASLILDAFGLPPGQGEWLRVGLTRWIEAASDPTLARERSTRLATAIPSHLTADAVLNRPASASLGAALSDERYTAAAWTMVQVLLDTHGVEGLPVLCAAWGQRGGAGSAFEALGTSLEAFSAAWQAQWPDALAAARDGIAATLAQRVAAVRALSRTDLLATLDPDNALFVAEETRWFDSLRTAPAQYSASVELLSVDGDSALARVLWHSQRGVDDRLEQYSADMRWRRVGDRWLLSDRNWQVRETEHLRVFYSVAPAEFESWLETAERVYLQVSDVLGYAPVGRVPVKLYPDEVSLRSGWPQNQPAWRDDYVAPDEACKLTTTTPAADARALARLLVQRALALDPDVEDWVREGCSTWQGLEVAGRAATSERNKLITTVRQALPFGRLYAWDAMPGYADLSEDDVALFRAQSWLMVDQLVGEQGADAVRGWLGAMDDGLDTIPAFERATGLVWSDWVALWQQRAQQGANEAWLDTARSFDVERAQEDVAWLADSERGGRRAGSAGGSASAGWLVERMLALGLEPGAPDGSFTQSVPLSYSEFSDTPVFEVRALDESQTLVFEYLQEWGDVHGGAAGAGSCNAQLVWVPHEYEQGMRFGGRVVLKRQQLDPLTEAADALSHGAGGLVLVRQFYRAWQRETLGEMSATDTLPVAFISEETWAKLVTLAGLSTYEANTAAPANLLPLGAKLALPYGATHSAVADNVIGKLPGSDPLAPALVLAAHYDGLGDLPDGRWYPSANQNASGVAVLLEVARVLLEGGQPPRNSVYFVAWGAEEMDLASSRAQQSHPLVAADATLGVINLDTVGAAESYYLTAAGAQDREGYLLSSLLLAGDLLDRRASFGKPDPTSLGTVDQLRAAGYPAVLTLWPDAKRLRTPLDTPDLLEPYKLATAGEVVTLASLLLAW